MKKKITLLTLFACLFIMAWGLSISEIQYTTFPGSDNTYPSRYAGKAVSTEGIVVANNYRSGGFFISEPVSGPYSGLLVLSTQSQVKSGDRIRISGTVQETFGMTTLQDVTALSIIEHNHPLPHPVNLTTAQLTRAVEAEAYEGVYVKVRSVSSTGSSRSNSRFMISDGTGMCAVNLGNFEHSKPTPAKALGTQFSSITGVVSFSFGEFSLNPVSDTDIVINQPVSVQSRSWGKIKSIYK